MIDLSKYRIIDLSHEMLPGELKIGGHYLHGQPYGRWIELQEFIAYGARMHFIQSQTHNGTHAESPYKHSDTGADIAQMPLESYMGEAVVCNFSHKKAGEPITVDDVRSCGVRSGDIVLAYAGKDTRSNPPYLTADATDWLIKTKIKCYAPENLDNCPPGTALGPDVTDCKLLGAGIAIVDDATGMAQITKPRVFFIALPARMRRVSALWVRAIALEEVDR